MGFGKFLKKVTKVATAPIRKTHELTKKAIKPLPGGKAIGKWGDKVMAAADKATSKAPLMNMGEKRPAPRPAPRAEERAEGEV